MTSFAQMLGLGALYFLSIVAVLEIGYVLGVRARRVTEDAVEGTGAVEAAVLGLVGLMLAFAFGSAQQRFDHRRELDVREANAIGTAYLRLDLLPVADQPPLRDLFRRYTDVRLRAFDVVTDRAAFAQALEEGGYLQRQIWERAVGAATASGSSAAVMLLIPALNEMIDITTDRTIAVQVHIPRLVAGLLACLGLCAALLAGYAMSRRQRHSALHMLVFAFAVGATVFVVLDLEFPRLGLIRVKAADRAMYDVRSQMTR